MVRQQSIWLATLVAGAVALAGCGGSSASSGSTGGSTATSPAIITAGDAPMSSVLAALVTVSAVTFTSSSSTTVQLLSQPRQIELTHLGGIRAPLDLHALPQGTYNSVAITVSAAQITYIDPNTNKPVVATAVIPSASATQTITLSPALVVSDSTATDIRFDFDLQKSLDLTGTTVTFTPVIGAAVARVKDEDDNTRMVHVNGTVTATSVSGNTITLTSDDTGLAVTLNVNSSTKFDDNVTLANLQVGAVIRTRDEMQSDGSLTAVLVEDNDAGDKEDSNSRVDTGIVTGVTRDTSNNLTAFTVVVNDSDDVHNFGHMLNVTLDSNTKFKNTMEAQTAGLATFDQTQVFPGAGVEMSSTVQSASAATVTAREIRPAAVNPFGLTSAAVTAGANGVFTIPLLLNNSTNFAHFAGLTTLNVLTNSATAYDGANLSATTVGSLAIGTPLVVHGFLSVSGTTTTLFAAHIRQEGSGF
ncbi:MAG TPA: DUF4382 domain-containing protein [Terriglobales bacterium]|nr:DUF4382 domain-containing protein [Terriglobales bacterium]